MGIADVLKEIPENEKNRGGGIAEALRASRGAEVPMEEPIRTGGPIEYAKGFQSGMGKGLAETAGFFADIPAWVLGAVGVETPLQLGPVQIGAAGHGERYKQTLADYGVTYEGEPQTRAAKVGEYSGRVATATAEFAAAPLAAVKYGKGAAQSAKFLPTLKNILLDPYRADKAAALIRDFGLGGAYGILAGLVDQYYPKNWPGKGGAELAAGVLGGAALASALNQTLGRVYGKVAAGGTRLVPGGRELVEDASKKSIAELEEAGVLKNLEYAENIGQIGKSALPTPGQVSINPMVDIIENLIQRTPAGWTHIQLKRAVGEAAQMVDVRNVIKKMVTGRGVEGTGADIQKAVELSADIQGVFRNELYSWLDTFLEADIAIRYAGRTPPASAGKVDLRPALKRARELEYGEAGGDNPVTRYVNWIEGEIERFGPYVPFRRAGSLRSRMLSIGRETPGEVILGETKKFAPPITRAIDSAMAQSARQASPESYEMWRFANEFVKQMHGTFDSKVIRAMLRAEPEAVFGKVSRKELPGTIRQVREAIYNTVRIKRKGIQTKVELQDEYGMRMANNLWEEVQGLTLLRIAERAGGLGEGVASGARAERYLDQYGEEALRELMLNKEQLAAFRKSLNQLRMAQSKIGEGIPGGVALDFATAGVVVRAMHKPSAGTLGTAFAMFLTPRLVRNLFMSDQWIKWMTIGLQSKPGTPTAFRAGARLAAIFEAERKRLAQTEMKPLEQ